MPSIDLVSPIVRILLFIVVLTVIELIIPFRKMSPFSWQRVTLNLTLTLFTVLLFTVCFAGIVVAAREINGGGKSIMSTLALPLALQLIVAIVLLDGATYLAHVLLHKIPWFWRLHKIHHADSVVDVTTSFRQHPLEALIRIGFLALPILLFGIPLVAVGIYRLLSSINALLEHSNVYTPLWLDHLVSTIWVSPRMHKIHHSQLAQETDSNYGNLLALYDRLFRTFTPVHRSDSITYGLEPVKTSPVATD